MNGLEVVIEGKEIKKEIKNASGNYIILKDISLKIYKGEFVSIMGPSGSGKSSLLNILGGLDTYYSGYLNILGQNLQGLKEDKLLRFRRNHIGMIFQDFNLIQTISVRDNLILPSLFRGKKKNDEEKIDYLLNIVGMYDKKNEICSYLSGGEKQRVAIARTFMNTPEILLADEPTGSLDSKNGCKVMELIKFANEEMKTTIVLVTHDEKMASYGKRRYLLKDGAFTYL